MDSREPILKQEHSLHPREFSDFIHAYPVISRRSGGVSIGVNLNLDKHCNFDCPYCQVDRTVPKPKQAINIGTIKHELSALLDAFDAKGICRLEKFDPVPDAEKVLRDIAISGDGEPTMVPEFPQVCALLSELQTSRPELNFKLVLITNSTLLDRVPVLEGIGHLLSKKGEIWAKVDAGTEEWFQKVNISRIPLDKIEANLITLGRHHPFTIQTMFHGWDGMPPPEIEIDAYIERLNRIKGSGSVIREIQLYTLARKPARMSCTPLPFAFLESVRNRIVSELSIHAHVYGVSE